jgi:hypothetical protein
MIELFRSMREGPRGLPEIGPSARTLGVRAGIDVPEVDPGDLVQPGRGGMSVSPDDPVNLPEWRRPPKFGGVGRDPVWKITEAELGPYLGYRPDPSRVGHGFVEPKRAMMLKEYQDALSLTQTFWRKVN